MGLSTVASGDILALVGTAARPWRNSRYML